MKQFLILISLLAVVSARAAVFQNEFVTNANAGARAVVSNIVYSTDLYEVPTAIADGLDSGDLIPGTYNGVTLIAGDKILLYGTPDGSDGVYKIGVGGGTRASNSTNPPPQRILVTDGVLAGQRFWLSFDDSPPTYYVYTPRTNGVTVISGTLGTGGTVLSNGVGRYSIRTSNSTASAIYQTTSGVGIGTNAPDSKLHVGRDNSTNEFLARFGSGATTSATVSTNAGLRAGVGQMTAGAGIGFSDGTGLYFSGNGFIANAGTAIAQIKSTGISYGNGGVTFGPSIGTTDNSGLWYFGVGTNLFGVSASSQNGTVLASNLALRGILNFDGGLTTNSRPLLTLNQQWSNGAVSLSYTGMVMNMTNTADNNDSWFVDFRLSGSSKFAVNEFGVVKAASYDTGNNSFVGNSAVGVSDQALFGFALGNANNSGFSLDIGFKKARRASIAVTNTAATNWTYGVGGLAKKTTTAIANAGVAATNIFTNSIPGNTLTNDGATVWFEFSGQMRNAFAGTNRFQVTYGSQTILDTGSQTFSNTTYRIAGKITRTGNTAQIVEAQFALGGLPAGAPYSFTNTISTTAETNGIATTLALATTSLANGSVTNLIGRMGHEAEQP